MSERNYKAEYKKFQSSTKAKKYRAELNQYNRKKGTYGNGDGKDASHKGGRIAGFEAESKNRGRAEKSRLKKENVAMFEAKFTDATLAPRIQHWASKHKGTGIGYGHVLAHLAVHMKEMGWEKSYRAVAKVAKELGKKRKVESITEGAKMIDLVRLYNQALKLTPGSASQKKVKREINRLVKVLKVQMKEGGPGSGRPKDTTAGDPDDAWDDEEGRAKPKGKTDADTDDDEEAKAQAFKDMEDEFGDLEEGTKAFLAYREMKEALNVAIYGIKKMRKFIDDAPYNPKFNMITKELYKWETDLEKKWRRVVPQISKISKDKLLEAVNWGRVNNVFVKFLKANTKVLEKYVKDKDLEKVKGAIKSIISGLSNAQRSVKLESVSINESAVSFWQDMFRPGPIPKKYITQLIKKRGELPSKKHIKKIYRDNGNPSSSELAKTWKLLQKEKYVRAASGMWRWNANFTAWESVNEAKANIYGIEFRKSPKDRKFKKASLTISSTQGLRAHRNMTMAILKKAEKLKKQSKWAEYRITVNGQPYMMGLGAKRITRFPRPKINDNIDIDEGFYDGTKKFEKNRKKNAEQLGYKVTGISDIKTDLQSTINEDDVVEEECCDNCHEGKECCSVHEAKETGIDVAKRVLKNKQYEKGPGWALDLTTAGFIMKIYNAYKSHPNLQRQMKNLPVKKMVNLAYKVMK